MKIEITFESSMGDKFKILEVWLCDHEFHVLSSLVSEPVGINFASLNRIGDHAEFDFNGERPAVNHYLITDIQLPAGRRTYYADKHYQPTVLQNINQIPGSIVDHGQVLYCVKDRDAILEAIEERKEKRAQAKVMTPKQNIHPIPEAVQPEQLITPEAKSQYSSLTMFALGVGVGVLASYVSNRKSTFRK